MGELDPSDRLNQACRDASKYPSPSTILKKTHSKHVLQRYCDYLEDNDAVLFEDKSRAQLLFWELWPGEQGFWSMIIKDLPALSKHLARGQKDPRCRHVFLESDHSRAPLNCTKAMLLFLLTYHQVDPSFLDHLFSFGDQDEPVDMCLSQFHYDDTLIINARQPLVAPLGRSGREIRQSFLLRAVERAPEAKWPWSMRQLAAYHSFDVMNGRTLWITVKGNDMMQKRIVEDTADMPALKAAIGADVVALFEMTLYTLLTYCGWCEESWRWFIRDIEEHIRPILVKAKTAPVEREPHFQKPPRRADTMLSAYSRHNATGFPSPGVTPASTGMSEKREIYDYVRNRTSRRRFPHISNLLRMGSWFSRGSSKMAEEGKAKTLVLEMFNYKDLQALNIAGQRIEEARLTVQLNVITLQAIEERYSHLADSDWDGVDSNGNDPGRAKQDTYDRHKGFSKATNQFLPKLRAITRSLEIREAQLASLRKRLEEGKTLFESLLQLRNLQVGRIYAEHERQSAMVMQNIAYRTEQETFSMRVITVVTLVFLPPTFLTSFFQSGILEWKESQNIDGPWNLRDDALKLFVYICIPLTATTFAIWLLASKLRDRRVGCMLLQDDLADSDMGAGRKEGYDGAELPVWHSPS
ncbi:hypothetical protein B0T25DRAFT_560114 [Lasiosphaeria hispida]|uniref:CorA-like transporter domain-containing protein n=1 Tax=Lasiosphaeria hispida TaxID=260671 RepID=A0AAJ0H7N6_9PEZI|nr:hypothetical protein B0T25DRAFT_560114 [Lasiosphaeria hispida]